MPQLLALDGAQILINVSSSPGRDLAATNEVGLGTATSWRTLMRTYAQLTTSFVIFCNRVGVDESISFWGGSEVIGPSGQAVFSAPLYDEGLFTVEIATADIRRERVALPLLRDERPELNVRELQRIVERAGGHGDRFDRRARRGGRVRRRDRPAAAASRSGSGRMASASRGAACAGPRRMTATEGVPPPAFELPAELAIDTDVARRVIAEFIRGQLEQAGFERAGPRRCRAGSTRRSWPISWPRRSVPTGCSRSCCRTGRRRRRRAADAESVIAALGCQSDLVEITPMVDGYFDVAAGPPAPMRPRCGAATSPPGCGCPCCTTGR